MLVLSSMLASCKTIFLQDDGFREKLAKGCSTPEQCGALEAEAQERVRKCKPNTMGYIPCGDANADLRRAKKFHAKVTPPPPEKFGICPHAPKKPTRRYLSRQARLAKFERGAVYFSVFQRSLPETGGTVFPPSTTLDLVGLSGNLRDGECVIGVVRLVDGGGVGKKGELYFAELTALATAPPASGTDPAEQRKALAKKQQEEAKRIAEEEMKTGRCHEGKVKEFRAVLQGTKNVFDGMGSGRNPELFELVAHKMVVATTSGETLTLKSGLGGEYHILAFSHHRSFKLKIVDGDGYAITEPSPYGDAVASASGLAWDTRRLQANAEQDLPMTLTGMGCVLVMVIRKY